MRNNRRILAGVSLWRPVFDPTTIHVEFVVIFLCSVVSYWTYFTYVPVLSL